ncbi:MAG: biopolymer transporter ExbD [Opitutaceae bacterium]
MITRPLDLAAKLRPEPRNFDALFFVNGGLLVLFFLFFGSRFVLAPALGLDFRLPSMAGANADATTATHSINVTAAGQIFANGSRTVEQLEVWLVEQAKTEKEPILLIAADKDVPLSLLAKMAGAAYRAGFIAVKAAIEEPNAGSPKGN